jgi:hypothetical protein
MHGVHVKEQKYRASDIESTGISFRDQLRQKLVGILREARDELYRGTSKEEEK